MKELIDRNALLAEYDRQHEGEPGKARKLITEAPTVDAVEMPKGKPGDYLEWDNRTGFRQIYHIRAVEICEDCMRYDLEKLSPVVNHPNIVRIMSREEAEKEWREWCTKVRTQEEPTLTAVYGERKNNYAD